MHVNVIIETMTKSSNFKGRLLGICEKQNRNQIILNKKIRNKIYTKETVLLKETLKCMEQLYIKDALNNGCIVIALNKLNSNKTDTKKLLITSPISLVLEEKEFSAELISEIDELIRIEEIR